MPLLKELRKAVQSDSRPQREIARASKIHYVTLSRFASGQCGLSVDAAERLAKVLGFSVSLALRKPR